MTNCQYRYNHSNTHSLSQQLTPIFLLLSMKMILNQRRHVVFLLKNKNLIRDRVLLLNLLPGKKKAEQREIKTSILLMNSVKFGRCIGQFT